MVDATLVHERSASILALLPTDLCSDILKQKPNRLIAFLHFLIS